MSRRVAVIGLPFFAQRTAEALTSAGFQAEFVPWPGKDFRLWPRVVRTIARCDLVYAIGSSVARFSPLHLISLLARPMLMHWVGTDVQVAFEAFHRRRLSQRVISRAAHWADAPWLVEELRTLGIEATERLLPVPAAIGAPAPLPAEFRVLIYLPARYQLSYDIAATLNVIRSLPEVSFAVCGGYRPPAPIKNLEVLGFVHDMPRIYARSTALLRLAYHDGMSHSVIEAMSFGRHVLWTYPFEGATTVRTAGEAADAIRDLLAQHRAGTLGVNLVGAESVVRRYEPGHVLAEVARGLEDVLAREE